MKVRHAWVGLSLVIVLTLGCAPHGALDDLRAAEEASRKGDTDEAIRLYTKAIASGELDPKGKVFAFYYRGVAWYAKQDYDDAIADYSEVIRLNPQFPSGFGQRGVAWAAKHDYDRAIADYTEAIRLSEQYGEKAATYAVPALGHRGDAWYAKQDYDRAIADYSEVIRLNPQFPSGFGQRGVAWAAKHDYDRAIADYTEAIRLSEPYGAGAAPYAVPALGFRGDAWYAKHDYDRAIADYTEAMRLGPQTGANAAMVAEAGLARRGRLQFTLGHYPAAVADWLALSKLKADGYTFLWLYLSRTRAGIADAKSELARQNKALKSDWPQPVIGLYVGELSPNEVLARALNSDPATQRNQLCEADFYIGEWYLLQGDKAAADRLLRKARDDCPDGLIEAGAASDELERIAR